MELIKSILSKLPVRNPLCDCIKYFSYCKLAKIGKQLDVTRLELTKDGFIVEYK